LDQVPDPCFTKRFFNNKYYYHGMNDPWSVHPAMAQDWPSIVSACTTTDLLPNGVESNTWEEGGWGSIRIGMPGATGLGTPTEVLSQKYQLDQVMLATSAIPNTAPHTELDFGTLVWVAYGDRLLMDFGYGSIGGNLYEIDPSLGTFDNNPVGHNTLVIPAALQDNTPMTNTSQIDGEEGTISLQDIDGVSVMTLDGSAVYGRDHEDYGWLSSFTRMYIGLEEGHILVLDSLTARADRGAIVAEEYWIADSYDAQTASRCGTSDSGTVLTVDSESVSILPICSRLLRSTQSVSAGVIEGTSFHGGSFVDMGEISMINRINQLDTRARFAWSPDEPQTEDIRIFALLSGTDIGDVPLAEWLWEECGDQECVTLSLDGLERIQLFWSLVDGVYELDAIVEY
jgi:hypothetical protein